MSNEKCPNCNKSLTGILRAELLSPARNAFINKHHNKQDLEYCSSCGPKVLLEVEYNLKKEQQKLEAKLANLLPFIPILTSSAPVQWEYDVLGIVTAQTTSGTGFMTELSRSFNDFFGTSSNTTNRKIAQATNLCKLDIRVQCIREGGNAIIGTDIDFNEIGAGITNMLMICMAGTAIKVKDINCFNPQSRESIMEIEALNRQLDDLVQEIAQIH